MDVTELASGDIARVHDEGMETEVIIWKISVDKNPDGSWPLYFPFVQGYRKTVKGCNVWHMAWLIQAGNGLAMFKIPEGVEV